MLRTHKLGEADLILVLLTANHGVVRVVAKGIRKPKSRFGARLDRFSRVDAQIYPSLKPGGQGLGTVTDAQSVASYASAIVADPDLFFAGAALLEMAYVFADSGVFYLLDAALESLAAGDRGLPPVSIVDQFVVRCLDVSGWAPSLVDCAQCGKAGPHKAFHPVAGGAVCTTCRPPGAMTPPSEAVHALWLLSKGRNRHAAAVLADPEVVRVSHSLLVSHVRQQLEVACVAYAAL